MRSGHRTRRTRAVNVFGFGFGEEEKRRTSVGVPKKRSLLDSSFSRLVRFSRVLQRAIAIVRDSEPRKTSLENPETRVERRAPSIPDSWEASRAPPRGGPPPRSGRTARLFAVARMGARVSRVFVHGVRLGVPRARRAGGERGDVRPLCGDEKQSAACRRRWSEKRDARARRQARETPPTGSIAYLYPGLPACLP